MARLGRYFAKDQPLHVIQRGNNRQRIFFADEDFQLYRRWLGEAAAQHGCAIHAYVLMPNHVHLLLTPRDAASLPRLMQSLGRRYVRYINAARKRTGTLWEGRYRAAPIDSERYLLTCSRYIELNPVRAGMVRRSQDYRWSSYRALALGAADELVTPHAVHQALGRNDAARQDAYRALVREVLDEDVVDALRGATQGGWALGDERFQRKIARAAGRRAAPLPLGRPPKQKADRRQLNLL
jgi:putative transposase